MSKDNAECHLTILNKQINGFAFSRLTVLDFRSVSQAIAQNQVQKKVCVTMENVDVFSNTKNQLYATIIGTIQTENESKVHKNVTNSRNLLV